MNDDEETLLELITEGGSLEIVRTTSVECHDVFIAKINEMDYALEEDGGEDRSNSRVLGRAESFIAALSLLDPYPWHSFYLGRVAKEFEPVVLAAATRRGCPNLQRIG